MAQFFVLPCTCNYYAQDNRPCTIHEQKNQIKPSHSTDDGSHTNTTSTIKQNVMFILKLKLSHNNNNNNNNKTKLSSKKHSCCFLQYVNVPQTTALHCIK